MKLLLPLLLSALFAPSAFGAGSSPCRLSDSVLGPYRDANATDAAMAASRRALFELMGCEPAAIDARSRKIFFEAMDLEFNADHSASIERWAKAHAAANPEGMFEAVSGLQHEMRAYLDRLYEPALDAQFEHVVLRYGQAKTIARLGPASKADVIEVLSTSHRRYGVGKRHNPQVDALAALGHWIDPANASFTPVEKYELAQILTALLEVSENVEPGNHLRLIEATLSSLAKSDDSHAIAAVEKWLARRKDPNDSLSRRAAKTLQEMKGRKGQS